MEQGQDPNVPAEAPPPVDDDEEVPDTPPNGTAETQKPKAKKGGDDVDIMDLARQHREEAEARAKAEREALTQLPDDIDPAEIRRLAIIEEIQPVQQPAQRTRDDDVADGRWDPSWNGRKNFKAFRKQGPPVGRPPARVIVRLEEVRTKEYGIGDDYWLEGESHQKKKRDRGVSQSQSQGQGQNQTRARTVEGEEGPQKTGSSMRPPLGGDGDDGDDDEGDGIMNAEPVIVDSEPEAGPEPEPEPDLPRTRRGKAAEKSANTRQRTQTHTQTQTQSSAAGSKRAAPAPPAGAEQRPQKKTRQQQQQRAVEVTDSDDDSDDELKFRFGRRR